MADLKQFGTELIKGNIGNAFKSLSKTGTASIVHKATTDFELDIKANTDRGGMWLFGAGAHKSFFSYSDAESAVAAYTTCPELQAIINRRAAAHITGKRWIMRKEGKGKGAEHNGDYGRKCRQLMNRPNPFQNGLQFEMLLKTYVDIFGWCVIMPVYAFPSLAAQGLSEASSMFLLPPYMLSYSETGNWRSQQSVKDVLSELVLNIGGQQTKLNLEQVIIIKDATPRMDVLNGVGGMGEILLFPESKVRAQQKPINNIIGAYDSRGELISYAGSQGIISPKGNTGGQYVPIPLTPDDEKDIKDKLREQYGIRSGQARYIISSQALDFTQMGRPTKDLMLFEEVEHDVRALCNAWPYPYKLLVNSGSSLNGTEVDALTRNFYQDSIIPEANMIEQQLAEAFKAEENGAEWQRDFSGIPCMQSDEQEAAATLKTKSEAVINMFKNEMITYNRALELLGEDTVDGGEVYYTEWKKNRGIVENTTPITTEVQNEQ